jgi:hypothetical protein
VNFSVTSPLAAIRKWLRVRRPVSLQRTARRRYHQLDRRRPFARRTQELRAWWEAIPSLPRSLVLPTAILTASIAVLFVPCSEHLPALSHAKAATAFLSVAWPVTGGSLAFSVVVLVFAFQTIAATSEAVGIRDLAAGTPLLVVVYLGIAAVLTDGLAMLGVGYQAPAEWAATWATIASGAALALLALLIAVSLRAVDPQAREARRVRLLRRRTMAAIRADAIKRLALTGLIEDGKQFGYTVSPLGSALSARPAMKPVSSPTAGAIADIRLDRLRRVTQACLDPRLPAPVVTAYVMRDLGIGTRLAEFPEALDKVSRRRLAKAFVKTRRSQSDALSLLVAAVDELHQEAMQLIGAGRAKALKQPARRSSKPCWPFLRRGRTWARLSPETWLPACCRSSPVLLNGSASTCSIRR